MHRLAWLRFVVDLVSDRGSAARRTRFQGQATIEYALVIGIVSLAAVSGLRILTTQIAAMYTSIAAQLAAAVPGA